MPNEIEIELPFAYRTTIRRHKSRIPTEIVMRGQAPFSIPSVKDREAPVATRARYKPNQTDWIETRSFEGKPFREVVTTDNMRIGLKRFRRDMEAVGGLAKKVGHGKDDVRAVPSSALPSIAVPDLRKLGRVGNYISGVLDMSAVEVPWHDNPRRRAPIQPNELGNHEMLGDNREEDLAAATRAYSTGLFVMDDAVWTTNDCREPVWSVVKDTERKLVQVVATRHSGSMVFRADRRLDAREFAMREADRIGWGFEHTTAVIETDAEHVCADDLALSVQGMIEGIHKAARRMTLALEQAEPEIDRATYGLQLMRKEFGPERVKEAHELLSILDAWRSKHPDNVISKNLDVIGLPLLMRRMAEERERRPDIWVPEEVVAFSP